MSGACVCACVCVRKHAFDGPHGCLSVWLPADNNNNNNDDDDDDDGGGGDDERYADDADDDDERRPGGRERAGQPAETGERVTLRPVCPFFFDSVLQPPVCGVGGH